MRAQWGQMLRMPIHITVRRPPQQSGREPDHSEDRPPAKWVRIVAFTIGAVAGTALGILVCLFTASKLTPFPNGWLFPTLLVMFGAGFVTSTRRTLRQRRFVLAGAFAGASGSLTVLGLLTLLLYVQNAI